jgi:hypothetical protein
VRNLLIALFLLPLSAWAASVININAGTPSACVLTPNTSTLLTVDATGNANATGTLTGACTGTTPPPDPGVCVPGSHDGDLGQIGYARMCAGNIRSLNANLHPTWNNTYAGLMSGPWPGNAGQFGFGLQVTLNAMGFGSFKFNTGATADGVSFSSNTSYGMQALLSVSKSPGDYFTGSSTVCGSPSANLTISSKTGTSANCKLLLNTDYYLNISFADYFTPHSTTCPQPTCTAGMTVYKYSN